MVKEKEIKIILKEVQSVHSVQRKVASCEACRKRKQRCEGDPPCKHCIFKGIPCVFLNRRHKKPDSDYVAEHSGDSSDSEGSNSENNELALAAKENMLISTLEIRKYVDFFMRFDHFSALFDKDKLLAPPNIAFETQAYAVGAFSAHYCGEYAVARQCLEKARFLAGSIFDSPTVEAVSAIVLMSNCWKKVLEHSMSSHYAKIGWNLLSSMGWYKLFAVPNPPLLVYAHTCQIFCRYDDTMSDKKKAKILFEKAEYLKQQSTDKNLLDHMHLLTMRTYAKVIKYIGSFIFFPTDTSTIMYNLDNLRIDETARTSIMEEISALEKHATQLGVHSGFHAQHNVVLIIRTVHLLTEWKSGNLEAAVHLARFCLDVCRLVQNQSRICTADFSHFCLLGVTVQFLCSIGNFDEALELCEHIKYTSELLGPLYKFIPGVVDKDVKMLRQKYLHPTLQHADFGTTTTNTTNTTAAAANATTQQFLNVQQQQQIANYYNIHYNNPNFFNLQNYNNNVNITNSINLMNATCPTTTTTTTSESGQTCAQQGMDTMASNRFLNFVNFVNSNQQVPDANFNFNPHLLNPASFNSSIASASAPKTSPPMMIDGIRHGLFLNSQNPQQVFVNPFHPSTSVFAPVAAPFQQPHSPQHPNPVFAPSPSNPHSPQHPNPVFAPSSNNPHSPQHPNPVFAPSSTNPHSPPHPASSVFAPSPTSHSQSPTPFLPTSGQVPSLFTPNPAAPSQNPVFASNEPPGDHPYDGHPYMPGKLAKSVNQGLNPRHSNYVTTVYSEDQIDEV